MTPDEYNKKLHFKLTALVSVLIASIKKIEEGMMTPGSNVDRMAKIRDNLARTLAICERAQLALAVNSGGPRSKTIPSGLREYTEMSTLEEYQKFKQLPPISSEEIADVDWAELMDHFNDV